MRMSRLRTWNHRRSERHGKKKKVKTDVQTKEINFFRLKLKETYRTNEVTPQVVLELTAENRLDTEIYQHKTNNSLMRSVQHASLEKCVMETLYSSDKPQGSGWKALVDEDITLLRTSNLARIFGFPNCSQPVGIKCGCIAFSNDRPMAILLHCRKASNIENIEEYGSTLAAELVHTMRNYTDECFNIISGTIVDDQFSINVASKCLNKLVESHRKIYPSERLSMNKQKKQELVASFLDVLCTTGVDLKLCEETSTSEKPDVNHEGRDHPIYLLNKEEVNVMSRILGGKDINIHIRVKTSLQKNFFALEMARRLNQDGGTVLITNKK